MNTKKFFQIILAVIFTLSAVASSMAPVSAATKIDVVTKKLEYQKSTDISTRNAGVYFPNSAYTATATLTRLDLTAADRASAKKLTFTQPWLDIRLHDSNGKEFRKVLGIVYVYFNLGVEDRATWDKGKLSIYYYDTLKKSWVECPSRLLTDKGSSGYGRISCLVTEGFGRYGMAIKR
ncbi:MAG: hypothetical protein H8D34_32845 [Chloroflexi bacterium]|nr:hypothetical protein [Chloroflexota bacterium]